MHSLWRIRCVISILPNCRHSTKLCIMPAWSYTFNDFNEYKDNSFSQWYWAENYELFYPTVTVVVCEPIIMWLVLLNYRECFWLNWYKSVYLMGVFLALLVIAVCFLLSNFWVVIWEITCQKTVSNNTSVLFYVLMCAWKNDTIFSAKLLSSVYLFII